MHRTPAKQGCCWPTSAILPMPWQPTGTEAEEKWGLMVCPHHHRSCKYEQQEVQSLLRKQKWHELMFYSEWHRFTNTASTVMQGRLPLLSPLPQKRNHPEQQTQLHADCRAALCFERFPDFFLLWGWIIPPTLQEKYNLFLIISRSKYVTISWCFKELNKLKKDMYYMDKTDF